VRDGRRKEKGRKKRRKEKGRKKKRKGGKIKEVK
jgi:hypothetical protein